MLCLQVLREHYEKDPAGHTTFSDMIEKEMATSTGDHRVAHVYSLLWLKR